MTKSIILQEATGDKNGVEKQNKAKQDDGTENHQFIVSRERSRESRELHIRVL